MRLYAVLIATESEKRSAQGYASDFQRGMVSLAKGGRPKGLHGKQGLASGRQIW